MLLISTVLPFAAVTMSSVLNADMPIMFSVAPITVTTSIGRPSSAMAPVASSTAAAPDMSNFIPTRLRAGFSV